MRVYTPLRRRRLLPRVSPIATAAMPALGQLATALFRRSSAAAASRHYCRTFTTIPTGSITDKVDASSDASSHVKTVGVVGAGQMGSGIAYVTALNAQCDVLLYDTSDSQLQRAMKQIQSIMQRNVDKQKLSAEAMTSAIKRIKPITSYSEFKSSQFVIEAASEKLEIKQKIFSALGDNTAKDTILATNTSSISITKIASTLAPNNLSPERCIGMHFMNPVPVMKLIEVITGLQTSDETLATTLSLGQRMGKTMTHSKDVPGFIANRLLMPYINEAITALEHGVGTRDDIDTTMKLGCNMPMGPLTLADFIGLDTCLAIMQTLQGGLGDDKYRPSPLLIQYVDAGWMGKKSGKGFYNY